MKCRILKKGDKFYAQYEKSVQCKGGKRSHSLKQWVNLKRREFDQRDGEKTFEYFETTAQAEHALRIYASEHGEGTVVKEFEA